MSGRDAHVGRYFSIAGWAHDAGGRCGEGNCRHAQGVESDLCRRTDNSAFFGGSLANRAIIDLIDAGFPS